MDKKETKGEKSAMWLALDVAWELGYIVVIPIVVLGFAGAYADKKFETSPLFLFIGIIIAFTVTSIAAYRKIKVITQEINSI